MNLKERMDSQFDPIIFLCVLALIGIGIVMSYSASSYKAYVWYSNSSHFLSRSLIFTGLGLSLMWMCSIPTYQFWGRLSKYLLIASIIMLILTLLIGKTVNGSTRWIRIGPFSLQATEFAKIAYFIFLARNFSKIISKGQGFVSILKAVLPHLVVLSIFAALFLRQPDLGSTILLVAGLFISLFISGLPVKYMAVFVMTVMPLGLFAVMAKEYRMLRILGWLFPFEYHRDAGYQLVQSYTGLGSGGIFGKGLGMGEYRLLHLPEAHTDFIFAAIGSDLGLAGMFIVLILFFVLFFRGVQIALRQTDHFAFLLAFILVAMITIQALFNMSVAVGLVPTKGFTLPLVSYGGSSILANCIMAGILLGLSRKKVKVIG